MRVGSHCQADPPKIDSQLLGGVPSGFESAQTYQSAFALLRLERLSMNQGCWSEVCDMHEVDHHLDAEPVASAIRRVEVFDSVPKIGSTSDIVRDVVAEVPHRRREEGRYPDRIRAKPCHMWGRRAVMPFRSPMPSPFES
jgi:hypothetical protein